MRLVVDVEAAPSSSVRSPRFSSQPLHIFCLKGYRKRLALSAFSKTGAPGSSTGATSCTSLD